MLTRSGWDGAPLSEVAGRTLQPYDGVPGRVMVAGPPVRLAPNAVVTLSLAFHELATNAAKYGALSVAGGNVAVAWTLRRSRNKLPLVEIVWRERGGPPVRPPQRRGFGSRLLERGLAQEFGGTVKLGFAPAGVECHICLPLAGKISAP
jgi:two-component sensor histidine kinase